MKAQRMETNDFSSAPISESEDNYGSTQAVQDKSDPQQFYVPWCGVVFYVMAFLGFFCAFLVRESLSVAIVAMVNQTAVAGDLATTNGSEDQRLTDLQLHYKGGEFNWDRNQQGIVLAAFYYGYGFTQIPGGWMADRFGGKWLFGGCILLSSVIAILSPAAATADIGVLIMLRVLSGLGEGVMLPATHALIARWSALRYRTSAVCVIFVGTDFGIILGMSLTGVLCDYGFAGGWPSAFYVFGAVGCVWSLAWFLLCYNSPFTHPRMSTVERNYWATVIDTTDLATHLPTPWRQILTSVPVWALALTFLANNWGYFTMATCLPLYMHDVLGLDITMNGALSAIPFVASVVMIPINGFFVDWLRSPGRLSTNAVRKIFCVAGFTLTGSFLILLGYVSSNRALAVVIMYLMMTCFAMVFSTVAVNQLDLAPLHAGKIMGLTYTVANLGSIAAPHAVSAFTEQQATSSQWKEVFFLTAAVYALGEVVFVIFGSGHRQSWADDISQDQEELRVIVDRNKH